MSDLPTTTSQRLAQELAELDAQRKAVEAQQKAHEAAIAQALKRAAPARCRAVEELYELLDIAPVTVARTAPDGTEQQIASD